MSNTFYFLAKDFAELVKKIGEFESKLAECLKEMGEGVKDDPNAWHDNFGFEEGQRQASIWSTRLRDLIAIKNRASVIEPSRQTDEVAVGSVVSLLHEDGESEDTFQIGSYLVFDDEEDTISYNSPLAQAIIGAKIGETRTFKVSGKERRVKITKIR